MKTYIEDLLKILPEGQKNILNQYLKIEGQSTAGEADSVLESNIARLLEQAGQGQMTMQIRKQDGQTNSEDYNQTLREIVADFNTLYTESNRLDALITNHKQLSNSILASLAKNIKQLEARIDAINLLADNTEGFGTASKESFSDASMVESDRANLGHLFQDRDGRTLTADLNAVIDQMEGKLKLGTSGHVDRLHNLNGDTVAKIEIVAQTGEGFSSRDSNFSIEKAIDNKIDTFWGEVILSSGTLQIPLAGVETGAICQFKIVLPSPETISQFSIKPYCEYPMEIVEIKYSLDDSDVIAGTIKSYDPDNPFLVDKNVSVDFSAVVAKSVFITLRQIHASKSYYIVSEDQINNRELWSKIGAAERQLTLNTVWANDDDVTTVNPTLSQDVVEQFDITWQNYLTSMEKNSTDNSLSSMVASLISPSTSSFENDSRAPKRVQAERYEYVYGAYEMGLNNQEYNTTGIYVSKVHPVTGNVQRVVIESKEWHPVIYRDNGTVIKKQAFDDNGNIVTIDEPLRRTSIEYSVSCRDDGEFIPILPLGQTRVNNEFMMFDSVDAQVAKLRFPAVPTQAVRVYKNEQPLPPQAWGWTDRKYRAIKIRSIYFDPQFAYTVDYSPVVSDDGVYEINFTALDGETAKVVSMIDTFNGENNRVIDRNCAANLSYYPYVDREKIIEDRESGLYLYNPIEVTLNPNGVSDPLIHRINCGTKAITTEITSTRNPETNIANPPRARLLNVTDYASSDLPVLNPYNKTPNPESNPIPTFEYYQDGKKVYFTETFRHDGPLANRGIVNGNAIVQIKYYYTVSGVRVKIVLRRTKMSDPSLTPKVDSYSLKFKVLV
jgi:hypothetical protein